MRCPWPGVQAFVGKRIGGWVRCSSMDGLESEDTLTRAPRFPAMRIATLLPLLAFAAALASNEGYATHFTDIGYPYGACGVSDSIVWGEAATDTVSGQGNPFYYVALNVFDDSGFYGTLTHPLKGADTVHMGTYRNGLNCGRWIKVRIGDWCTGNNGGEAGKAFCTPGTWISDSLDGASLDVVVLDQCTDGNAWCRDSKYHLDFHTAALGAFRKDGKPAPMASPSALPVGMNTNWTVASAFGNRKISWDFEAAPNYQGEPRFWFSVDSKPGYMRLIVTHLPNGIHLVEQLVNGTWTAARMEGDMGQMWILPDATGKTFQLRITDASDQLVLGGRTWSVTYPAKCGSNCGSAGTPADAVVGSGGIPAAVVSRASSDPRLRQEGRTIHLDAPDATEVDFVGLTGNVLGSSHARGGTASWTSPRSGLVVVRWRGTKGAGSLRWLVP